MRALVFVLLLSATAAAGAPQKPSEPRDPITALPQNTVAAVVDGEIIRLSDIEAYSRTKDPKKLFQLNQQLFDFRESMLGLMLGERLLKLEAEKAGLTVDELLNRELEVEPVTAEEIQQVILRQPPGLVDVAQVTPLIRQHLEERKREQARARYIQELIAKARKGPKPLVIHLQPPRQSITVASSDPAKGTGAVEIVEFSDFECPFCAKVQPVLKQVLAKFEGKVRHVWKDSPLPMHRHAVPAAIAARCAGEQGRFWQYHDVLFTNQNALTRDDLRKYARGLNLDADRFDGCLDSEKYRPEITAAIKAASTYAVAATPTIFINGRMVTGVATVDQYARIIADELGN